MSSILKYFALTDIFNEKRCMDASKNIIRETTLYQNLYKFRSKTVWIRDRYKRHLKSLNEITFINEFLGMSDLVPTKNIFSKWIHHFTQVVYKGSSLFIVSDNKGIGWQMKKYPGTAVTQGKIDSGGNMVFHDRRVTLKFIADS